ncbi:Hypothetical protein NTJ_10960 [Nesidiocoris tenuis]|uniref:Uncharacterized protein n=1 Tax=Nesidiocoris tenuis TaxID=355587 RepID=A0ABN7B4P0_9HEMI|nr:Hypothetical protein NTJ_10960 [Nesidiocoris tenuis]
MTFPKRQVRKVLPCGHHLTRSMRPLRSAKAPQEVEEGAEKCERDGTSKSEVITPRGTERGNRRCRRDKKG